MDKTRLSTRSDPSKGQRTILRAQAANIRQLNTVVRGAHCHNKAACIPRLLLRFRPHDFRWRACMLTGMYNTAQNLRRSMECRHQF